MSLHPLYHTKTWVFDLDNTLYAPHSDLFGQIDVRMGAFISDLLDVDLVEARRVQKDYFFTYGTTLSGLIRHHNINPHTFMEYVHDIDLGVISADEVLDKALEVLPGDKLVYTNGSADHARRVLAKLEIEDRFTGIYDTAAADFIPKPDPGAFGDMIAHFKLDPARAVMVEDMARNLEPAFDAGMKTIWCPTDSEWSGKGADSRYIDYVVDDLPDWLLGVAMSGDE
jgi:putative hydrolase of the HAD superfamily